MTSKQDQDKIYISLLGLAEYFRTTNPPNIKKCIQSLQALFTFMPPTKVVARTHLQMGQVLSVYTQNVDLARYHLEQAVIIVLLPSYFNVFKSKFPNFLHCINYFIIHSGCYLKMYRTLTMSSSMRPVWLLNCIRNKIKVRWLNKSCGRHYKFHSTMFTGTADCSFNWL